MMGRPLYHAPADCPVCTGPLIVTGKGCLTCGSILTGEFAPCDFCALDAAEIDLIRRFVTSRGDHGVVDAAGLDAVIAKLGGAHTADHGRGAAPTATPQEQVLARVAAGEITADVAAELIARL